MFPHLEYDWHKRRFPFSTQIIVWLLETLNRHDVDYIESYRTTTIYIISQLQTLSIKDGV